MVLQAKGQEAAHLNLRERFAARHRGADTASRVVTKKLAVLSPGLTLCLAASCACSASTFSSRSCAQMRRTTPHALAPRRWTSRACGLSARKQGSAAACHMAVLDAPSWGRSACAARLTRAADAPSTPPSLAPPPHPAACTASRSVRLTLMRSASSVGCVACTECTPMVSSRALLAMTAPLRPDTRASNCTGAAPARYTWGQQGGGMAALSAGRRAEAAQARRVSPRCASAGSHRSSHTLCAHVRDARERGLKLPQPQASPSFLPGPPRSLVPAARSSWMPVSDAYSCRNSCRPLHPRIPS